jgi:hypothetical protein
MLNLSNRSVAVYHGPIDAAEISKAFAEARETSALILEVECPLSSLTAGRSLLEGIGFTVSGTVSGNREMCVRFKKKIRDAGDGLAAGGYDPNLAVPAPVLPVSDVEKQAVELMKSRLRTDGVETIAARIKADAALMFDRPEPTLVPEFVARKNAVEQEKIQVEIDRLTRKSESA